MHTAKRGTKMILKPIMRMIFEKEINEKKKE